MAFKTIAHYARASRAAKRANVAGKGGSRFPGVPRKQRCAIRVTYSRNTVRGQWRAHGRYIARESAATEPASAGFDAESPRVDIAARLNSWQTTQDRRMWKLIVSPEFGDRVDLPQLTRDLMKRIEKDLGSPLEWVAVAHFNTEHPHVHVALRGVGGDGQEIRLSRDYVKAGIRSIAEDLCTRQLGHRTDLDAAEAERREVREKRFTSLDRLILKAVQSPGDSQLLNVAFPVGRRKNSETDFAWSRRQHLVARMTVLEDMGIATTTGAGTWSVRPDMQAVLRAMQRAGDRQKVLAAHGLPLSDDRLQMSVSDLEKADAVEGRVLVHGEDEHSGRRYLILEGIDARAHLIEYTDEMEIARARGELRPNSFARLRKVLIENEERLEVEDFGDSEEFLNRSDYFKSKARQLLRTGAIPVEDGYGGWLGRYQRVLREATKAIEYPDRLVQEPGKPERSRDHDR
jgi:type IV secretory pathway VirD2 relaxase